MSGVSRSVVVHGVLLLVALVAATATWSAQGGEAVDATLVPVWDRGEAEVVGLVYRSGERRTEIERRGTGPDAHLWGREILPPLAGDPDGSTEPRIDEFPVGRSGTELVERLARLRAIRDLGPADEAGRETYGLSGTEPALDIHFADGSQRTLVFGSSVAGGGARYALDVEGQRMYAVSPDVVSPFDGGASGALRLTDYHGFGADDVAVVSVRSGGAERTMERRIVDMPPRPVWLPVGSDRADVAFGNFMQQIDRLWIMRYDPAVAPESLEQILRADYTDDRGRHLGFLELYRGRDAEGAPAYYMRTPRTVVLGEVYADQGQRIDEDVTTLLRAGAAAQALPPGA